jgi:predicted nucleic acid-binding protein
MRLVVDSDIFVAGLDPKDALHEQCLPVLERIVTGEIEALCPVLVLVETTCALRRRSTVNLAFNAKEALAHLPSILWLDINPDVAERACVLGIQSGLRGGDLPAEPLLLDARVDNEHIETHVTISLRRQSANLADDFLLRHR